MIPLLAVVLANPLPPASLHAVPEVAVAPELAAAVDPLLAPEPAGFDLSLNSFAEPALEDVKPEEYGKWHGSLAAGATFANGNTDRTTFNASAKAVNRREKDRRTGEFLWNYAEEEDSITERRVYALGKYDYFVNEKLYYLGQLTGESNDSADLDLRIITSAGAGYQFSNEERWKFAGEAGLSYIDEDYSGTADDDEFVAARLAYNADWKPDDKWAFGQKTEVFPSLEDSDDVTARVDTNAKLMLTEKMFAQLQWILTWDNTPPSGASGTDSLFLIMLGWSF
jgi:putative salt-induced outer membrane protein